MRARAPAHGHAYARPCPHVDEGCDVPTGGGVLVCACVRACACAGVHAWVRACARGFLCVHAHSRVRMHGRTSICVHACVCLVC